MSGRGLQQQRGGGGGHAHYARKPHGRGGGGAAAAGAAPGGGGSHSSSGGRQRGRWRRGGARGGGGGEAKAPEEKDSSSSISEQRWDCLRTLIVTIGDEVALIPQQIQRLAREAENAVLRWREEEAAEQQQQQEQGRGAAASGGAAAEAAGGGREEEEADAAAAGRRTQGRREEEERGGDAVAGVRRVQLLGMPRVKQEPQDEEEEEERRRRSRQQQHGGEGHAGAAAGAADRHLVKTEDGFPLFSLHPHAAAVPAGDTALPFVHEERLAELLVACASQLPLKIGIYASLLGLWYKKSRMRPLCYRVVQGSLLLLEDSVKKGDFSKVTLLLRFFIALAGSYVVRVESVFELLKKLLSLASAVPAGATTEHLLLSTLSSLPWISVRLYEQQRSTMDAVVALAHEAAAAAAGSSPEQLLLQQATLPIRVPPPAAVAGSSNLQAEAAASLASLGLHQTRLDSLLDALASMVEGGWRSQATLRFYQSADLYPLLRPSAAAAAPCMPPALSLSAADLRAIRVSPLQRVLRLPVSIEKIDVPLASHDRWILEDYILTIFRNFRKNVALCAEQLLRVPVEHEQFEYVLVECLFSELFQLPHAPLVQDVGEASFLVARVLHRVSQLQNSLVAVVEAVLTSLVRHAAYFDYNTTRVLANFFAYWLNAWGGPSRLLEEWLGLSIPPACVKAFVRLALEKAFRLRYRDELISLLPACVEPYWPPNPLPECPYTAGEEEQQQPQALEDDGETAAGGAAAGGRAGAAVHTYIAGMYEYRLLHEMLLFSFDHISLPLPQQAQRKKQRQKQKAEEKTTQGSSSDVSAAAAGAASSAACEEEMMPEAQRDGDAGEEQQHQQEEGEEGEAAATEGGADAAAGAAGSSVGLLANGADAEEEEATAAADAAGEAEQENAAADEEADGNETSNAADGAAAEAAVGDEGGEKPAAVADWDDGRRAQMSVSSAAAGHNEEEKEVSMDDDDEEEGRESAARFHYREVAAFLQERMGKKPWRRSVAAAAAGTAAREGEPREAYAAAVSLEEAEQEEAEKAEEEQGTETAAGAAGETETAVDDAAADSAAEEGSQRRKTIQRKAAASPWTACTLAEVFVYALLSKGVKTLTHTDRLLQNYSPVLRFLAAGASDEALPALLEASPAKTCVAEKQTSARQVAVAAAAATAAAGDATVEEEAEVAADEGSQGAAAAHGNEEKGTDATAAAVQDAILQTIFNYWRNSSQKTVLTVQQFYMRRVLLKESIVRFLFENLSPEERDDSRVMEILEQLLQLAIDEAQTKTAAAKALLSGEAREAHASSVPAEENQQEQQQEAAAATRRQAAAAAAAAATAAAENLVHTILEYFMRELLKEEQPVRRGTLQARLLYISRDYASHINVSTLHEQLSDILCPEVEQFLTVTYQVQQHYHFLHSDRVEPEVVRDAAAAAEEAQQAHAARDARPALLGHNGSSSSAHGREDAFSAAPVLAA